MQAAFALHQLGRLDEAKAGYLEVLRLRPRHFDALHLLGALAMQNRQAEEALEFLGRAIESDPEQSAAHSNFANALRLLNRPLEAIASCDRALFLDPANVDTLVNRSLAFSDLERNPEALADLDRALALRPDAAKALDNRGHVLRRLARYEEAAACFARLLEIAPEHDYARGVLLHVRLQVCDWTDYAPTLERVLAAARAGRPVPGHPAVQRRHDRERRVVGRRAGAQLCGRGVRVAYVGRVAVGRGPARDDRALDRRLRGAGPRLREAAGAACRAARERGNCALFDTQRFCRDLERAYAAMWERHLRGEPPQAIALPAAAAAHRFSLASLWRQVLRSRSAIGSEPSGR